MASQEMQQLCARYGGYDNIPWHLLSLREEHADDVTAAIEADRHEDRQFPATAKLRLSIQSIPAEEAGN